MNDMNWTPEQYWEFVAGLVGDFEHNQMRDTLTERGLSIVPQAARESGLPQPETMLLYASVLEKPQYTVKNDIRHPLPTGEIIEAACAALRHCAALSPTNPAVEVVARAERGTP